MMAAAQKVQDIETLIVGMGITGLSCARFLAKLGIAFRLVDDRIAPPMLNTFREEFADVEIRFGRFDEQDLYGVTRLILSPGVSRQHPFVHLALQRNIQVIGDIELFAQHANAPVIGITGSNGKSTVTTLIGEMLGSAGKHVQVGGNLGKAALDLLCDSAPDYYVLELSSFQLDTTNSLNLSAAVLLNISPDHMDRYANIEAYARSKARIFQHAEYAVINGDDAYIAGLSIKAKKDIIKFLAASPGSNQFGLRDVDGVTFLAQGDKLLVSTADLQLQGRHNWSNALAALAVIYALGQPMEKSIDVLKQFKGLPHRCQLVANHNGILWINDSKATNIGAAKAAIDSMNSPIILIAGGDGKGADFAELYSVFRLKVKLAILFGKDADRMYSALRSATQCLRVKDMSSAVDQAGLHAKTGDIILLAPACASLDMYTNYMARGDDFAVCAGRYIERIDVRGTQS